MEFKISEKAVKAIKKNGKIFAILAAANELSDTQTVRRWLQNNKINGPLITNVNVALISKYTGLDNDSILKCLSPTQSNTPKKNKNRILKIE